MMSSLLLPHGQVSVDALQWHLWWLNPKADEDTSLTGKHLSFPAGEVRSQAGLEAQGQLRVLSVVCHWNVCPYSLA